ncbi:MAG: MerC domain-containing protein [Acidobacteriota bacterium]
MKLLSRARLDRLGAFASVACALHCLAAPLVLLLLPTLAPLWLDPMAHLLLAVVVVPLALVSMISGYRRHGRRLVPIAAAIGVALVLGGMALPAIPAAQAAGPETAVAEAEATTTASGAETTATGAACSKKKCCPSVEVDEEGDVSVSITLSSVVIIVGSVFLVLAHVANLRLCSLNACGSPECSVDAP